jgi:UDP-N-acetylglucosamine--N-acetylmuramyl-(pentapeptide) pyrophosphoryl-undecaprenol N-acetylglucosamine transferase
MGGRSELPEVHEKDYVRIAYCDRMDLAISASSFAVSRAGSSTVSEFSALGLPAAYVPYPVGNGEQKLNVADVVTGEGGLMVLDADFDEAFVANTLVPLISNSRALDEMSKSAKKVGIPDGTSRLLALVKGVL